MTKATNDLKAIHLMYVQFEAENGRPAANAQELEPFSTREPDLYKSAYERLVAGDYKVAWGTSQNSEAWQRLKDQAFAWSNSPTGGNYAVVMGDGSVRTVPQAEFEALLKLAEPPPSGPESQTTIDAPDTQAAPESDRSYWAHAGGQFAKAEGSRWVEKAPDGEHQFEERRRTDDFVELHDPSRNISVQLFADHAEAFSDTFRNPRLYDGQWQSPP